MPGLDLENLKNKKARRQSSGWSPKEGENLIRVLPYTARYFTESLSDFAIEFRSHFLRADGVDTAVRRCLKDRKEQCPFCQATSKYRESENPALKKAADQIRSSERHLMNIINLNAIGEGIQTYECGPKVYDGILDFMANPAWGDLTSPTTGRNISLQQTPAAKSGTGFIQYAVIPHPNQTDITPHLPAEWKEKLDALETTMPPYPTSEEIESWLKILGMFEGPVLTLVRSQNTTTMAFGPGTTLPMVTVPTVTAPALVSIPPTIVTAATVAPAPMVAATGTDEVSIFAGKNGIGAEVRDSKIVPQCFSKGPGVAGFGFNPTQFPCEKGCPVRADCQLKHLGLS